MLPTPDLSHLTKEDFDKIYEPAEDTFLLLDALEEDTESLKSLEASICLEIGSGSGCVSSFIAKILGRSVLYLCTDINSHACRCTRLTGRQNNVDLNIVQGSLAIPFQSRLTRKVDVLLFNPPYVPTLDEEADGAQNFKNISGSWAGGLDGMQITNVLLNCVESLLSRTGRLYLVALKQNNIPKIIETMREIYHLNGEVVLQRRAGREHLFIIRFIRQDKDSMS